jgi:hypothetical protein
VWLPRYYRRIRQNADVKDSSGTLGVGVVYRGRVAVKRDPEIQNSTDKRERSFIETGQTDVVEELNA